jgi:hypothetical protein
MRIKPGARITVTDRDGRGEIICRRSGTVVYIHPQGRFATVLFDNGYRESCPLRAAATTGKAYKQEVRAVAK